MPLIMDAERGRQVAQLLYHAFETTGIHGVKDMPESQPPDGVQPGSLAHLAFITQTVSIDYMRTAATLWDAARRTYADPATRYLFDYQRLPD